MQVVKITCPECGNDKGYMIDEYPQLAECSKCDHLTDVS